MTYLLWVNGSLETFRSVRRTRLLFTFALVMLVIATATVTGSLVCTTLDVWLVDFWLFIFKNLFINNQGQEIGDECRPTTSPPCSTLNSDCRWDDANGFTCTCKAKYMLVNSTHCGTFLHLSFCCMHCKSRRQNVVSKIVPTPTGSSHVAIELRRAEVCRVHGQRSGLLGL